MKNIFYTQDTFADILNLWQTEDFKRLQMTENSMVNIIINEIKDQTIGFYNFTDEKKERFHMTLWFNHIAVREYDNPYIHDLYLFHELYHIANLPKKVIHNFEEWREAMWENELKASLSTEVFIYYWHPELRQHTFSDEIWYDLLLEQYGTVEIKENNVEVARLDYLPEVFQNIYERRVAVRNGKDPENKHEKWFSKYNNYKSWFERWRKDFVATQEIRQHMINNNVEMVNVLLEENSTKDIPFYKSC